MNKKKQARLSSETKPKEPRKLVKLPLIWIFFVAVWGWASCYYGDVFRISRDNSFWVPDTEQMNFVLNCHNGWLWYLGRMFLAMFRHPWLGGLILSLMLTVGSWLIQYCLRLSPRFRWCSYLPSLAYIAVVSYLGLNIFFETETGRLLGIPLLIFAILCLCAIVVRLAGRKDAPAFCGIPQDETMRDNYVQLAVFGVVLALCIGFVQWQRPYVRVICKMIVQNDNQDWQGTIDTAHENAELSYRPISANYAIALVHTDQQCNRMYDIRLEYDSLYLSGWGTPVNNGNQLYIAECDFHAGLVETAYHCCMERMVMNGPYIHAMELMTKCALMRSEWKLAEKYLAILDQVPFEGSFCKKYRPMLYNTALVNSDDEMGHIRLTEPMHDSFENMYQKPTFLGYNIRLYEGRSVNALWNSLATCLYTKLMPDFVDRLNPLNGSIPPDNVADGILLATNKRPGLDKRFQGMDLRAQRLGSYLEHMQPYLKDRPAYARQLFDKYKGYYPYYYFFGNLKATKKSTTQASSNSGVN